ncbi:hypothetical protein D3C76_1870170 [compost metagenome]
MTALLDHLAFIDHQYSLGVTQRVEPVGHANDRTTVSNALQVAHHCSFRFVVQGASGLVQQ